MTKRAVPKESGARKGKERVDRKPSLKARSNLSIRKKKKAEVEGEGKAASNAVEDLKPDS